MPETSFVFYKISYSTPAKTKRFVKVVRAVAIYLINTSTLKIEVFHAAKPAYAILSHTWEDDEVSFKDLHEDGSTSPAWTNKQGSFKVKHICRQARYDRLDYIWIESLILAASMKAAVLNYQNVLTLYNF